MNISEISLWLIGILILFGSLLSVISAFGLIRLPDIYTRCHAVAKSATLGIMCILLGTFLYFWLFDGHLSARVILGIIFVFVTSPVASHLITRAAYRSKVPLWEKSVRDDLKGTLTEEDYHLETEHH